MIGIILMQKKIQKDIRMFGNLDIKLGAEKRVRKNRALCRDNLEAYEGVVNAAENLEKTSVELDMLNGTIANIENSNSLASAVADATGDNATAVAVGRESLRMSLNMIGQAHLADEAYAGSENLKAGAEGAGEFLKAAWDKVKETAKKIWDWIKELITKVTNWILDIFGRKEDSAEKLIELLKKLKENDKTKLEATEFSKDVQLRLAKEMPLLAASKNVSSADIETFIDETAKLITSNANTNMNKELVSIKSEINAILNKFQDKTDGGLESINGVPVKNSGTTFITTVEKFIGLKKGYIGTKEDVDNQVEDLVGEFDRAIATLVGMTPVKKTFLVKGISENGAEAIENIKNNKIDGEDMTTWKEFTVQFTKVVSGIFVKTITIDINDISDATGNAEYIKPLEYSECTSIAKKLKDTSKTLEKTIKTFNSDIDERKKQYEKTTDELEKYYKTPDTNRNTINDTARVSYIKGLEKLNGFETTMNKTLSASMADTAKSIVRSKFAHIVIESTKLYIKK